MATKHSKKVAYREGLQPIKAHLDMWLREAT